MIDRYFQDVTLEEAYKARGYLHLPGFLSTDEVQRLSRLYQKKERSYFDKGFHRTLDLKDAKKKMEICRGISEIVTPRARQYLKEYRYLLTSFMTKEKGAGEFDIHQNWSFVDERYFTSLVIWIPLQDVDEYNGTMYFIPGSDRWDKGIRGNNIRWQYEDRKAELLKQMVCLPMKAGDAVIFDDATIHYTSPNHTDKPRISIAQVMIPDSAQPIFYHLNPQSGKIEKYAIDRDFYHLFTNRNYAENGFGDLQLLQVLDNSN